jgi:hypothetical protein
MWRIDPETVIVGRRGAPPTDYSPELGQPRRPAQVDGHQPIPVPITSRAAPTKAKIRTTTADATFTTMAAVTTLGLAWRAFDIRAPQKKVS